MESVTERDAVRAIVLSESSDVLLLRIRSPDGRTFWITPGGGLDPDETTELCLRRELSEELGLEAFDIGPLVWRRQHTFNWGDKRLCQRELFHVVHVPLFDPRMSDVVEAEWVEMFQWWPLEELRRTVEQIVPAAIADIVADYLARGAPSELPGWEIVVD